MNPTATYEPRHRRPEPRHRRPAHVDPAIHTRCTCAATAWRSCPSHYPTEYAERYAKHKAVA